MLRSGQLWALAERMAWLIGGTPAGTFALSLQSSQTGWLRCHEHFSQLCGVQVNTGASTVGGKGPIHRLFSYLNRVDMSL